MGRKRKYQKVTGHWVYGHLTPDYQFVYFGRSKSNNRWRPNRYRNTSLQPFIEQYGWDNLIHLVIQDGLTEQQAKKLEGALIKQGKADGWCINKNNNEPQYDSEYYKHYRERHKEKQKEYHKRYYKSHKEEIEQYYKQYREEHRDKQREYTKRYYKQLANEHREDMRQRISTPDGKIYNRVAAFNRNHTPIETPLEAKNKYLEYGYIPSYIKNNDLV